MKVIHVYIPANVECKHCVQCTKTLYVLYTSVEPKFQNLVDYLKNRLLTDGHSIHDIRNMFFWSNHHPIENSTLLSTPP